MRSLLLWSTLIAFAKSTEDHIPCSAFGLNLSAENRCLRSLLNQCLGSPSEQHTHRAGHSAADPSVKPLTTTSTTATTPRSIRQRSTASVFAPTTPTSTSPATTTTKPMTAAPAAVYNASLHNELVSNLSRQLEVKAAKLELQFGDAIREAEQRFAQRVEVMKLKNEAEMHKMQKLLKLMTRKPKRLGSNEYIYMDERESWYIAEEQCLRWGGHLVSIASDEENQFVLGMHSWFVWTGLNDIQRENKFVFSDGRDVKLYKWGKGQPDNSEHNENCVEQDGEGKWSDSFCFQSRHYVCKRAIE